MESPFDYDSEEESGLSSVHGLAVEAGILFDDIEATALEMDL